MTLDQEERLPTSPPAGYELFFRDEYPQLVATLTAFLGDRFRAEDLAQESLGKALRDWNMVSELDRPGAWVRRVAINAATDVIRRRRREQRALRQAHVSEGDILSGHHQSEPTHDANLWASVRQLPELQRSAVVLRYVADLPLAEIADILDRAEGTIKSQLAKARITLARELSRYNDPEEDDG